MDVRAWLSVLWLVTVSWRVRVRFRCISCDRLLWRGGLRCHCLSCGTPVRRRFCWSCVRERRYAWALLYCDRCAWRRTVEAAVARGEDL